ncbi:aminotransferase class IV family protein [Kitasatospora sp. MAP5-34]|uniref:aminotransferase class IV family protein n=1 Tax=Kitasatospora sp. MAP5-34 TaxID=3035102 RepID=UPI0024753EF5|nr:aminotransferase class IV family protein [Kitasatospora sp. MAP5-34]MDH6579252.1 branched-subunit amino acid aminotransferase/4-amino-4-deoxychorismate lyase [Kitasatospora sp. MAP5-34]
MEELNGRPVGPEELRALALTNYGHFTTMRVEGGRVRGLALHLERLVRDCRVVFGAELDPGRLLEYLRRAVPAGGGAAVLRVTVFDPALDIGHIGGDADPAVLVTARPAGGMSLPAIRVRSMEFVRDLPAVKSVGLFGALHQRRLAQRAGYDDVLFVDGRSVVSEGGTWNIGFVRGDEVVRPEADSLPGTTMELLRQVRDWRTEEVTLGRLGGFEAAFATNAAIGVRPIAAVDDIAFAADHPVIDELRKAYFGIPDDQL